MNEEYRQKEQEFMDRHDALCENVPPALCDCSVCPVVELCKWLEENDPFRPLQNEKEEEHAQAQNTA